MYRWSRRWGFWLNWRLKLDIVFCLRGLGLLNLELVLGKSLIGGKSGGSNCFEPKQNCWGRGGGNDTLEKYVGWECFIIVTMTLMR